MKKKESVDYFGSDSKLSETLVSFFSTEGALRRPMIYDTHPSIHPIPSHPIPSIYSCKPDLSIGDLI